jgi:hypothetical protein
VTTTDFSFHDFDDHDFDDHDFDDHDFDDHDFDDHDFDDHDFDDHDFDDHDFDALTFDATRSLTAAARCLHAASVISENEPVRGICEWAAQALVILGARPDALSADPHLLAPLPPTPGFGAFVNTALHQLWVLPPAWTRRDDYRLVLAVLHAVHHVLD